VKSAVDETAQGDFTLDGCFIYHSRPFGKVGMIIMHLRFYSIFEGSPVTLKVEMLRYQIGIRFVVISLWELLSSLHITNTFYSYSLTFMHHASSI